MEFFSTPTGARATARVLAAHYTRLGMRVRAEKGYSDVAPYRTTLIATRGWQPTVLVEVLEQAVYPRQLRELARWLFANRYDIEMYVAFGPGSQGTAGTWSELRDDGVGILIIDEHHSVREEVKPRNPALVVNADPRLRLGGIANKVVLSVKKFNEIDRTDGFRDMVDLVEGQTKELAILACRRGWLQHNETSIRGMKWSVLINHLAAPESYVAGRTRLVEENFKLELLSFTGSRNLVDHPVRTRRELANRERQFHDRMVQGPRLLHELLVLCRKVRDGRNLPVATPARPPPTGAA
jgi:hypothetical protein